MSLIYQILGKPFRDNALHVCLSTGSSLYRFLFDCGEAVLSGMGLSEIQENDGLFFSHFHTDHIAGMDSFIRVNYDRSHKKVKVYGPEDTLRVLGHRLQGFTWNLVQNNRCIWEVQEIQKQKIHKGLYYTSEGFSSIHDYSIFPWEKTIDSQDFFDIKAISLYHGIPSLGYLIQEKCKFNIDKEKLASLGFSHGPWLKKVKEYSNTQKEDMIKIGEREYNLKELQEFLLVPIPGESIAYLTDFLLDDNTEKNLLDFLPKGCILVCESQYSKEDKDLARKNYHLTSEDAAHIAKISEAKELILIHFSQRYQSYQIMKMLEDAMSIFPETHLPQEWISFFREC
ncbi:MAG: ribonuclease Z [Candidatus Brocadiae bacterium]|nr:ribonuclease Z [Candidatus Brocadiia bacterium]